ncbi:hypothetical protein [Streptomyces sp. NBC_01768]|uniref:hypothetical protein n=1 Tax=Streptomyces sp. NBC_01768 TaxID=2975938 RepID=UPI002DD9DE2B|nr:hypothetical protein [Streptomyces sp. NBC_01768]WSC32178.1 hypothetical protein OG902_38910 [Streptomyces sp. NBC_01768]
MTTNEIGGNSQMSGVVQACDVHGGVHHHAVPQQLPTPRQLPHVAPHVEARAEETKALEAARLNGSARVVISRLVGVGKSVLAVRWLSSITDAARLALQQTGQ